MIAGAIVSSRRDRQLSSRSSALVAIVSHRRDRQLSSRRHTSTLFSARKKESPRSNGGDGGRISKLSSAGSEHFRSLSLRFLRCSVVRLSSSSRAAAKARPPTHGEVGDLGRAAELRTSGGVLRTRYGRDRPDHYGATEETEEEFRNCPRLEANTLDPPLSVSSVAPWCVSLLRAR